MDVHVRFIHFMRTEECLIENQPTRFTSRYQDVVGAQVQGQTRLVEDHFELSNQLRGEELLPHIVAALHHNAYSSFQPIHPSIHPFIHSYNKEQRNNGGMAQPTQESQGGTSLSFAKSTRWIEQKKQHTPIAPTDDLVGHSLFVSNCLSACLAASSSAPNRTDY